MMVLFVAAIWIIAFSGWALITLVDLHIEEIEHEEVLDELWEDDDDLAVSA